MSDTVELNGITYNQVAAAADGSIILEPVGEVSEEKRFAVHLTHRQLIALDDLMRVACDEQLIWFSHNKGCLVTVSDAAKEILDPLYRYDFDVDEITNYEYDEGGYSPDVPIVAVDSLR